MLQQRWYAGGLATLLAGALVFTGMTPAVADVIVPPPVDETIVQVDEAEPAPEQTEPAVDPDLSEAKPGVAEPTETDPTETDPTETDPTATPRLMSLALDGPGDFTPFALGPDGPGVTAPYVFWRAVDATDTLIGGATFLMQGPRDNNTGNNNDARWSSNPTTVVDCVATPCTGADLDPDAGEFVVKTLGAHTIQADRRYRVSHTGAPAGYAVGSTAWVQINGTNTALGQLPSPNPWAGSTYDFGTFVNNPIPPVTVRVNKQVLRDATANAPYLVGATFELRTNAANPATALPGATCTITSGTFCDIVVPGAQTGVQYFAVETTPAPGTFALGAIATGTATGALTAQPYPGSTGVLPTTGGTVNVPRTNGGGDLVSIGQTTNSILNPGVAPSCTEGLRIGLVLDTSGSIDAGERTDYAAAVSSLITGLITPTNLVHVTPITFNTGATVQAGMAGPASAAQAAALSTYLGTAGNYQNATNWDAALNLASQGDYDIVLMVTDGAPTLSGAGGTAGNVTLLRVENAVLSANAVKFGGAPVWAVGVAMPAGSETNLKAISGTVLNQDYFTSDWSQLENGLRRIAQGLTCQVGITVDKTEITIAQNGTETETPLRGGWDFSAALVDGSQGTLSGDSPQTTVVSVAGSVEWVHSFTDETHTASVTITETAKENWTLVDVTCLNRNVDEIPVVRDGDSWTIPSYGVGDSISCVVKNRQAAPATVLVDKTWVVNGIEYEHGEQPEGLDAELTLTGPGAAGATAQDWGVARPGYIAGHTVTIDEEATIDEELLPGCELVSSLVTSVNPGEALPYTPTLVAGANAFVITNTVTCIQELTLTKVVVNDNGGTDTADLWTLSATPAGGGTVISGQGSPAGGLEASFTSSVQAGVEYTLDETLRDGYDWTTLSCTGGHNTTKAFPTLTLGLGESVTCTFTNDDVVVPVEIDKADGVVEQLANGDWVIRYAITVTNTSATLPTSYSLTDTPAFDSSFQPATGYWVRDGVDNPVVTDVPMAAGGSHSYTYVATTRSATTPAAPGALVCTENGGGFFNTATVTFPGGTDSDWGCAVPAAPAVTKTSLPTTQNTVTGEWTLRYQVTVGNTSGIPLAYTLTDVPDALPNGVTGGTWAATGPVISTDGGSGALNPGWNGAGVTQLATGHIQPGATHTYTITRTVAVTASVDDSRLECDDPDEGIWNSATVTNGVGGNTSEACTGIDRPEVGIDKSVASTVQEADGTWVITYSVVVRNESTTRAAVYNLTDTLLFGGDIDIESATWAGPSGSGAFALPAGTATFATNRVLAPRTGGAGTETYTVTVRATIDQAAWEGGTLECQPGQRPAAGGFLNGATVTADGDSSSDYACEQPQQPTIVKDFSSALQDDLDPDKWIVSYTVQVLGSGFDTWYSLSDVPGFPVSSGVVLGAGTAQRTGDATVYDITSGVAFPASGPVALGANQNHTWTITWEATIADGVTPPADRLCGTEIQPGSGFYNEIDLLVGGVVVDEDDACGNIVEGVRPSIAKTVTTTAQDAATGDWTITYRIEVDLPANAENLSARYFLVDALEFGGDIEPAGTSWADSAGWTGPGGSGGAFAADGTADLAPAPLGRVILPGTTHVYTVTATATVSAAAIEAGTITCEADETGPFGGFLNTAVLRSGGQPTEVDACSEPVLPEVEKTGTSVTQNADRTQTLLYTVTVRYPATDQSPLPSPVSYTLTDAPELPAGVQLAAGETWQAVAGPGTPAPDQPSWDGTGTWTVTTDELVVDPQSATPPVHTYLISARVLVTGPPTGELVPCEPGDDSIPVWNTVQLTSGEYVSPPSDACLPVDWDDVGIVKTHVLAAGETSVEPGDTFDYVLTVTNWGTRPATNVRVTDSDLNARLDITGLTVSGGVSWQVPPGWTENGAVQPNDVVDLTIASLAVGQSVDVTITVTFLPAEIPAVTLVPAGGVAPEPATPIDALTNVACVATALDGDPANNCDDDIVPTRDVTGVVFTSCQSDAPLLGWVIKKSQSLIDEDVSALWEPTAAQPGTLPANVPFAQPGGSLEWRVTSDEDLARWPGSAFTPSGIAIDYPGWRAIQAGDIAPGGGYINPATGLVMTPEQQALLVYNGLIVDPSEIDFAWRLNTRITFTVNPTLVFEAQYPPATPECFQARRTEVQIEKTASVDKTDPGKSFTYDLAVENVSDDSAAEGVVVTDAIPSSLRVTDVSWPGEGDASVFPNWQTCAVSGQDAAGYGGTLRCVLFGPLQPMNSDNGGATVAPTITLTAMVHPNTTASVITNVAVVDYHTFGDPDDPGRDSDDAIVTLSALPATGGVPALPLMVLGFLALLGGVTTLIVMRRRRGEAHPTL